MANPENNERKDKVFLENQSEMDKIRTKQEIIDAFASVDEKTQQNTIESLPQNASDTQTETSLDEDSLKTESSEYEYISEPSNLEKNTESASNKSSKTGPVSPARDAQRRSETGKKELVKDRLMKVISGNARLIIAFVPITFIILLVIAILSQTIVIYTTNLQKADFEKKTSEINLDLTTRIEDVNDKYTDERLKKLLTQDDLYVYTNAFWSYELVVNDTIVKNDVVSLPASTASVTITLREVKKASQLPDSIISIGSVTRGDKGDTISSHIKLINDTTQGILQSKDEITTYQFLKQNMKSGNKIVIELSDQLGSKLNMPYTQITVQLK